jgi:adenosylhomocysteine nucleosidase
MSLSRYFRRISGEHCGFTFKGRDRSSITDGRQKQFMLSRLQYVGAAAADRLVTDGVDTGQFAGSVDEHHRPIVIAFVGMAFEAKIAAGPGVLVFCRNARSELEDVAESAARRGYRGIISFGVAGGLASHLRTGDWVVASAVHDSQTIRETDASWSGRLSKMLAGANYAPIVGVDAPIGEPAMKRELHEMTGAAAVDMESHVVARVATEHHLAFAAVRVIVDPAHRIVPSAALLGMGPNGRTDVAAVLRDLCARPSQLSRLARVAVDAFTARAELQRVRRLLGPHFGLVDLTSSDNSLDRFPPTPHGRERIARQVASG